MNADGSKTGRQAGETRASPRLGLCQILALRLENTRLGMLTAEGSDDRPSAPVIRLPIRHMTRQ